MILLTMVSSLPLRVLVLGVLAVLVVPTADAQAVRSSQSIYLMLRGALTSYFGDLDRNSDSDPTEVSPDPGDGLDYPGYGIGAEVGYHIRDNLSLGLAAWYHDIPDLSVGSPLAAIAGPQSDKAGQLQALVRYLPLAHARVSPYAEVGGALVFGQGQESERDPAGDPDQDVLGYGPVVGLGLDLALTPQIGLFLVGQSTIVYPDAALDGGDASAFGVLSDDADYDILLNLSSGLRYAFRAPYTVSQIASLECPAELEIGQAGSFMMMINEDATRPITSAWRWGDGSTGSGMTASHSFSDPGTYTVSARVMNEGGEGFESCLVTVIDLPPPPPLPSPPPPPPPPMLANCRATQVAADADSRIGLNTGDQIMVDASATGADRVVVDLGDGGTAMTLPVRHAYSGAGTYTVTITAENEYGTDTCRITVAISDPICADVTGLNTVYFEYGSTTLSTDAKSRLDENVEILRRCPDVCVTINAYTDGSESGDAIPTSQDRAAAVLYYYVGQLLDANRLRAVGHGEEAHANSEDPASGDSRARRTDSIPSSCAGF